MNPYSYSHTLDVQAMQRRIRREALMRWWRRWSEPILAGVVVALAAWLIVAGYPEPGPTLTAALESRP